MLIVLLIAVSMVGTFWVFRQAAEPTAESISWWQLVPGPDDFFTAPRPCKVAKQHLEAGLGEQTLGTELRLSEYSCTSDAHAALIGATTKTLIGIPNHLGLRMKYAAASAGVAAYPVAELSDDAATTPTAPLDIIVAQPMPAWFLGLDSAGSPLQVQLVSGSTILLYGSRTDAALDQLPANCPWVTVIRGDLPSPTNGDDGSGPLDCGQQWRGAWDPAVCRVVVTSSFADVTTFDIHADATINTRGVVEHRGRRKQFSPVNLQQQTIRPTVSMIDDHPTRRKHSGEQSSARHSLRTARVSFARRAKSASAG